MGEPIFPKLAGQYFQSGWAHISNMRSQTVVCSHTLVWKPNLSLLNGIFGVLSDNKLLSAHKHLCENLTSPYLMEFLEYCLITNCCLLTKTDSKKMRSQIGKMGPPTLEILAHPDFRNGLTCGVWFWWNHIGNFGLPIFPLWVWFWCVVFVKLYWKYWLAHNSNMGLPVVCGFRETIMEIWASQYWKSWRAHIGKIGNIL